MLKSYYLSCNLLIAGVFYIWKVVKSNLLQIDRFILSLRYEMFTLLQQSNTKQQVDSDFFIHTVHLSFIFVFSSSFLSCLSFFILGHEESLTKLGSIALYWMYWQAKVVLLNSTKSHTVMTVSREEQGRGEKWRGREGEKRGKIKAYFGGRTWSYIYADHIKSGVKQQHCK